MSMRRHYKLIWWLLPLLALRGLVPVGFMLDTSHGELAIVVCPGHVGAQGSTSSDPDAPGTQHNQSASRLCPFAIAAGPALQASAAGVVSFVAISQEVIPSAAVSTASIKAQHAHLIRGPPALS
jgi:hypothetical protein